MKTRTRVGIRCQVSDVRCQRGEALLKPETRNLKPRNGHGAFRAMAALLLAAVVGLLGAADGFGYSAVQNKADNTEVRIVPAPGKVTVDGDLKEWDLSGAIFMFIDETSRDAYHVRASMMYDKDYLYVGGQWADPTPMLNQYAFGGDVGSAWNADAIQMRFVSDPAIRSRASTMTGARMPAEEQEHVNHITLWYSTQDEAAGYFACYTLGYKDAAVNPAEVEGAYVRDADGRGCTFEYRIPWAVLRAPRPLKAGDGVQMQFQVHWGNDQGTELKSGITDVRNPNSNALGYMGPDAWGMGRFMAEGSLLSAADNGLERAQGHVPVPFELKTAGKVSIMIRDAAGRAVRTGIGARPYAAGAHTWLWDGLDERDRPLPAGKYTAMVLTHNGIGQEYVTDVGVSGEPPYQTEDGSGGWAGDYWEPMYVAIEGDRVILGTGCAEAQKPTICTDLEGRKQYGTSALGHSLAVHDGFGYFVMWASSGKLVKFDLATGQLKPFAGGQPEVMAPGKGPRRGLAALDDQTLVMSTDEESKLYLIDLASGVVKGEVPLDKPAGLAVDGQGALYAVSGNAVGRVDVKTGAFTPLATGLDEPKLLACDAAGNVYVSLIGTTMQVWKLSPQGEVLQKFGKAGGRQTLGKFDPAGMLRPYAIAVDKNNRLWVCENDRQPKRYSVWNPDGALWKDFYGSLPYSTGIYVDPETPEQVFAENVRYRMDYERGTWQPEWTILRDREEEGVKLPQVSAHNGGRFVVFKGRKFLAVPAQGAAFAIYELVDEAFVPRLVYNLDRKTRKGGWWIDANNDGHVQTEEKIQRDGPPFGRGWSVAIDKNLNLYTWAGDQWTEPRAQGRSTQPYTIMRLNFAGFAKTGALQYAEAPVPVVTDEAGGSPSEICVDADGSIYALVSGGLVARGERAQGTGSRVVKFSAKGEKLWEYHNVHVGFAWTSSTYTPGFIVAAFRMWSVEHPDLLPVTGYYGQYFLLDKKTGAFVDALCQDQRSAYTMDHTMVLTENFNGTIWQHPKTKKTYFSGGDADARIWELTGLDTLRRGTAKLKIDDTLAAQAVVNSEHNRQVQLAILERNSGRKSAMLSRLENATVDGRDNEWQGVPVLPIGDDPPSHEATGGKPAQVQIGYDDTNLYARFEVKSAVPFLNTPTDYKLLFKSGSALELCLTPHLAERKVGPNNRHPMEVGDLRLLIARTKDGKLLATRYRPKIAGGKKPAAAYFETQAAGREDFDEIAEWNDLPMNYRETKDGYIVEVAIPWKDTAVKPVAGTKFLFDAGIITGNQGGTRNATRAMWGDRTPEVNVNNDIPTESRMHPNGWGLVVME